MQLPKDIKILFIIIGLAIVNTGYSQDISADSVKEILAETKHDSGKVKILLQIARSYNLNSSDREKSVEFYSQALQFETNNFKRAVILDTIGLYNWQLGNFDEAIVHYNEALVLFADLKDSTWLGKVNNNIASANWGLGNSNEALKYYQEGLKIRRAINDLKGVSNIQNNIGLIYQDWGLYDDALKWHNEALGIAMDLRESDAITYSYTNVGKCYEGKKDLDTALYYYEKGHKNLVAKDKNSRSISFCLTNIGGVYSKMGELDSALVKFKLSLIHAIRINNKNRIAIAEYNLGKTYLELNKIDSANLLINASYNSSQQNNYNSLIKDNQFALAEIEEKKGNISNALKYFKSASALKDTIFNKEKIAKFTDLQIRYNQEHQLQENIQLRQNNKIQELTIQEQKFLNGVLIVLAILILIILIFISKSRISFKKLNTRLEKSEKELLATNANKDKFFSIIAHDLKGPFNGLLGITGILESEYDQLSSKEIKEMILLLKRSSLNTYELLEGLLQWAQTQTDRMEYKFESTDIYENSIKVIELLSTNANNKKIRIENKVNKNTLAFADEKSTATVLRNLISNAIKFTE
ncbi:MAG: tetratricopeptide repeat-containing sensor histidine kinase, partial [Prolixibacteraceae bacterium]|nr:tetratricopeptide repeat-containing sensor histidine kinase [Prolixibacteraceae bacterium]